jgi:TolB protein
MARERLDEYNVRHSDIYLMNADGSNKHWARPTPYQYPLDYPSWSPDGTHLLVTIHIAGTPFLARLTLATGAVNFVSIAAGGPAGTQASYDPTGKKIIYVGPDDGATIEKINADGTGHVTLFSNTSAHFSGPRYSPDGKRILFVKSVKGNQDVYVKNADGSVQRLTTWSGSDGDAAWSTDGSKIMFCSNRSGQYQLWVMPSTGGTATRITHTSSIEDASVYTH